MGQIKDENKKELLDKFRAIIAKKYLYFAVFESHFLNELLSQKG